MVELAPPDSLWSTQYESVAGQIRDRLGPRALAVEHIGSTAIPGVSAKPIIDIAVCIDGPDSINASRHALEPIGFLRIRRQPRSHRVLVHDVDGTRREIVHLFNASEWERCNQRLFRDRLLADPRERDRYHTAKVEAAAVAESTREYTELKAMTALAITNRARAEHGLVPLTSLDT